MSLAGQTVQLDFRQPKAGINRQVSISRLETEVKTHFCSFSAEDCSARVILRSGCCVLAEKLEQLELEKLERGKWGKIGQTFEGILKPYSATRRARQAKVFSRTRAISTTRPLGHPPPISDKLPLASSSGQASSFFICCQVLALVRRFGNWLQIETIESRKLPPAKKCRKWKERQKANAWLSKAKQ